MSMVWPPDTSSARCGNGGGIGFEQRRQQVAFEVVHGDRRHVPGIGQRAAERRPGQQRADEAGTRGVGDAVELRRAWFAPRPARCAPAAAAAARDRARPVRAPPRHTPGAGRSGCGSRAPAGRPRRRRRRPRTHRRRIRGPGCACIRVRTPPARGALLSALIFWGRSIESPPLPQAGCGKTPDRSKG